MYTSTASVPGRNTRNDGDWLNTVYCSGGSRPGAYGEGEGGGGGVFCLLFWLFFLLQFLLPKIRRGGGEAPPGPLP